MCCRKEWYEDTLTRWVIDTLHWYIHRKDKREEDTPPPEPPEPIDPTRGGA